MKRIFIGAAALALVMIAGETASAGPRWGVGIGGGRYYGGGYGGYSGIGVNYGTRIGNSGYLNLSYGTGYGYSGWGGGYYSRPAYYTGPVYGSPYYYNAVPGNYYRGNYGYSYSNRRWGW